MLRSYISGMGFFVPENKVTNSDLEHQMETSHEWILERSGIEERRWVDEQTASSDLAVEAAKIALSNAKLNPQEIDFVIFATLSPDYFFPGSGVLLQRKLGLPKGTGALDVRNQCTGFIYGLSIADQFIKTGMYKRILLVGAEVHSKGLDISTRGRDVAVLFGDGAGAVVLQATNEDRGILSTHLHSDGNYAELLWMECPGSSTKNYVNQELLDQNRFYPKMVGREVFKHAVICFPQVINEALAANELSKDDVQLVIPHQANVRITEAVRQRLGLPPEKVYSNIHKYGNTTAASIPIAMNEAVQEGKINRGDILILAAFGSGFTWASAAIKW